MDFIQTESEMVTCCESIAFKLVYLRFLGVAWAINSSRIHPDRLARCGILSTQTNAVGRSVCQPANVSAILNSDKKDSKYAIVAMASPSKAEAVTPSCTTAATTAVETTSKWHDRRKKETRKATTGQGGREGYYY